MACRRNADLRRPNQTSGRFDCLDRAVGIATDSGYFAILDDVDAEGVRRASVAPGYRIMPSRTATPLQGCAEHRVPDVVNVQNGTEGLCLSRSQPFVVYARGTICVHVAF